MTKGEAIRQVETVARAGVGFALGPSDVTAIKRLLQEVKTSVSVRRNNAT